MEHWITANLEDKTSNDAKIVFYNDEGKKISDFLMSKFDLKSLEIQLKSYLLE